MGFPASQFVDQNSHGSAFQCGICRLVPEDAMKTVCGHMFCASCISDHLATTTLSSSTAVKGASDSAGRCPICRFHFESPAEQNISEDSTTRETINRMHVRCSNPGCSWSGEIQSLGQHQRNECPFANLNLVEQLSSCCDSAAQMTICSFCASSIPMSSLKVHQQTCPGQFCMCDFALFGCNEQILRMDLEQHMIENNEKHLQLVIAQTVRVIMSERAVMQQQHQEIAHLQNETNKQRITIEKQTKELDELRKFISNAQRRQQLQVAAPQKKSNATATTATTATSFFLSVFWPYYGTARYRTTGKHGFDTSSASVA